MINRKAAAVSMETELYDRAKKRAVALGFPTFSAYMVQLLRADLIKRGELTLQEEPAPPAPVTEERKEVAYTNPKRTRKP